MGFKGIWRAGLCLSGMEGGFIALWDSELKSFCFQGIRSSLMETLSLLWFHIVRIRAEFTPSILRLDPSYCLVCWRFLIGVNICAQHSFSCSFKSNLSAYWDCCLSSRWFLLLLLHVRWFSIDLLARRPAHTNVYRYERLWKSKSHLNYKRVLISDTEKLIWRWFRRLIEHFPIQIKYCTLAILETPAKHKYNLTNWIK